MTRQWCTFPHTEGGPASIQVLFLLSNTNSERQRQRSLKAMLMRSTEHKWCAVFAQNECAARHLLVRGVGGRHAFGIVSWATVRWLGYSHCWQPGENPTHVPNRQFSSNLVAVAQQKVIPSTTHETMRKLMDVFLKVWLTKMPYWSAKHLQPIIAWSKRGYRKVRVLEISQEEKRRNGLDGGRGQKHNNLNSGNSDGEWRS